MNFSPSIDEFYSQTEQTKYYDVNENISTDEAIILNKKFEVRYLYILDQTKMNVTLSTPSLPSTIAFEEISESSVDTVVDFIVNNFYLHNSPYYDEKDIAQARIAFPQFFKTFNPVGRIYRKDKKVVSLVLLNKYEVHPATNDKTIHIGYWGYDREQLAYQETQGIKGDWLRCIRNYGSNDFLVDTSVDFFNEKAIHWLERIGFVHRMLRLDKRPTP